MKIGGEYTFEGPRDLVWEMLLDPQVLAKVLPGAESLERVGENEFAGALKMKVGPVQGDFQGKVRLEKGSLFSLFPHLEAAKRLLSAARRVGAGDLAATEER